MLSSDNLKPPLPKEDYPVDRHDDDNDAVFAPVRNDHESGQFVVSHQF